MDETKKEAAGAEECRNRKRVQLLPAASSPPPFPAGSARCLWTSSVWISHASIVCEPTSSTKVRAGRQLARRPALIPARGQPHRLRKPRTCK